MDRTASFDVFDTVLARLAGSPVSTFLFLGKRLRNQGLVSCSAEAFARHRQAAEERSFRNAGGLDSSVRLEAIYRELGLVLRLSPTQQERLVQAEKQLESELLRPVPQALKRVDEARKRQERICFISDMYLGHGFIVRQLAKYGIYQTGDGCYVSCDHSQAKVSGRLYHEVSTQESISLKTLTHCGNNAWADVKMARKVGAAVHPFEQGNLNGYEDSLERYSWQTEGLSSALAGASRLARLSVSANSDHAKALRDVSASVAAPLLIGFTLWVLNRAQSLGLKRLYFLARDGQILLAIAQRLLPKLDFDCELHYLYGSRQAWSLPSLTEVNEESIANIFPTAVDVDFLSVRILLARFDLTPEALESLLSANGFTARDWDRQLSAVEHGTLRQLILSNAEMQQAILQQAEQARRVTKQYLAQEGLLSEGLNGIVDLGTGATLHRALAAVLDTEQIPTPHGFYLGLREGVKASRFGFPEVYLQDMRQNLGFREIPGVVTMMETFCSADHGSVVGYQTESNGKVVPVLTHDVNQPVLDWGLAKVHETICAVAERVILDADLVNPRADLCQACLDTFEQFWSRPKPSEARAWGAFPMEDGWGSEAVLLQLAQACRWQDVLKRRNHRHWWIGGAIAQTPAPLSWLLSGREWMIRKLKRAIASRLK